MDYLDALRYLYSLADFERSGRFADRPDVAPVLALLAELGDPHLGRPTLHIAGSKGKGSVAAMAASILQAAGLETGLYTSPHLNRFTERIQVAGEPVSSAEFAAGVARVKAAAERVRARMPGRALVTFDILTALGFLIFRERGVKAQVIEVGLGGLLDSTNVFQAAAHPAHVAVITNIGLEHREVLGDTIPEIARQKAGIIVRGRPTVMAPQRESAADVIREVARDQDSDLTEVALACHMRRDSASSDAQSFRLRTPGGGYQAKLPLIGRHQLDNAATSVVAVEKLASAAGISLSEESVKKGLEAVKWPGRIEIVKRRPLIVVDAAHTADSARRLRDAAAEYLHIDGATLVVGVMGDKDLEGLAMAIEPIARRVIATRADHPRALDPEAVARVFQGMGIETFWESAVPAAVDAATRLSTPSDAIVVLGSVALAGEARAHILGLERDPPL
ncbi:MAG TPA: folylpolyglutamate synthase/dihydrofolate synthase family protein [Dehalococcoidia bacterium]|nr:folylpolyglutamate synthase/dihydrofolate synthase family protein [Dehalococcoidia bacterium]